ncbi:MAG: hypothetical protein LBR07_05145 [Puniceicoccales bacterium]|jgi:hypothetical protein|nr:hypothetical protein [Puniceicoccales bacterium]
MSTATAKKRPHKKAGHINSDGIALTPALTGHTPTTGVVSRRQRKPRADSAAARAGVTSRRNQTLFSASFARYITDFGGAAEFSRHTRRRISESAVSRYLAAITRPTPETLHALLSHVEPPIADLLLADYILDTVPPAYRAEIRRRLVSAPVHKAPPARALDTALTTLAAAGRASSATEQLICALAKFLSGALPPPPSTAAAPTTAD